MYDGKDLTLKEMTRRIQTSRRHFNLPNHSSQHMTICGLFLHQGNTESRKNLEQKFIFQIGTLNPHGINERFSFNYFILVFHVAMFLPIV